jgi:hypothetical protein
MAWASGSSGEQTSKDIDSQLSLIRLRVSDPDHVGMSLADIKAEQPIYPFNVTVTVINSDNSADNVDGSQSYILVMEARDRNGVSVSLEIANQTIPDSKVGRNATIAWKPELSGKYEMRLMAITNFESPTILSPISSKEVIITGNSHCDQSLWDYVYHPSRLKIVNECVAVTGIASFISTNENDGDEHVGIRPDPEYMHLVNEENKKHHNGAVLTEVICHNAPKKIAPTEACKNYEHHVDIPPRFSYVRITGSYVLDTQHNMWAEIHPVTSIVVIERENPDIHNQ